MNQPSIGSVRVLLDRHPWLDTQIAIRLTQEFFAKYPTLSPLEFSRLFGLKKIDLEQTHDNDLFLALYSLDDLGALHQCLTCHYFHGQHGVVCAVHPDGVDGECGDRVLRKV